MRSVAKDIISILNLSFGLIPPVENNNINSRIVIEKWKEHLSGKRNWQYQLWPVLIYQSWKKSLNAS